MASRAPKWLTATFNSKAPESFDLRRMEGDEMERRYATRAEIDEFLAKEARRAKWLPWTFLLSSLAGVAVAQLIIHWPF